MEMKIRGRAIGKGHPVYVVAEMSGNHGGDFQRAADLVLAARDAGADAIKLQTYTPDTITLPSNAAPFRIEGTIFGGRTLHDLYGEAFTPWEWQPRLKRIAEEAGLHCFSTPFDFTAVDFLEQFDVPAYKIASYELVDLPLIERVARTGKPLILSTGMATLEEVGEAVTAARRAGATEIALLKCTSAVPAPIEEMNLRTLPMLSERFGVVSGLSDHSPGLVAPVVAVALGASIIEKHLKLSDSDTGPDVSFSLSAAQFKEMVTAVRMAERALGDGAWRVLPGDVTFRRFRRSLFVAHDIAAGELLTAENIRSVRPANGLHPRHYPEILGRRAARALSAGEPLGAGDFE
jgi:pseudaminic acid synthase